MIGPVVLRSPETDQNGQKWTGLVFRSLYNNESWNRSGPRLNRGPDGFQLNSDMTLIKI